MCDPATSAISGAQYTGSVSSGSSITFSLADSAGPKVPLKKSYSRFAVCAYCCATSACAGVVYTLMFADPITAVGGLYFAATIVPGKPERSQLHCHVWPPRSVCGTPGEPEPSTSYPVGACTVISAVNRSVR